MKILIDSSYFCGLKNPKDGFHKNALYVAEVIEECKYEIVISNYIFLETITVLSQRLDKPEAVRFGKNLKSQPNITVCHFTPKLDLKTWQLFQQIENKNVSYVDCSNIILMKEEKISKLATFDKDFKKIKKQINFNFEIIS